MTFLRYISRDVGAQPRPLGRNFLSTAARSIEGSQASHQILHNAHVNDRQDAHCGETHDQTASLLGHYLRLILSARCDQV